MHDVGRGSFAHGQLLLPLFPSILPRLLLSFTILCSLQLIFRGLRVRMGMHCGIHDLKDVTVDPTSNHTTYSGHKGRQEANEEKIIDISLFSMLLGLAI